MSMRIRFQTEKRDINGDGTQALNGGVSFLRPGKKFLRISGSQEPSGFDMGARVSQVKIRPRRDGNLAPPGRDLA